MSSSTSNNNKKIVPCSHYQNPLCILYGSATGNSEHIAKDLTKYIQSNISILHPTFDHVICCELDQYKKIGCLSLWESLDVNNSNNDHDNNNNHHDNNKLSYQYRGVLIICSTTGNGDPPENASRFVRHLKKAATTATHHPTSTTNSDPSLLLFRNVCYAVLGLGDTNYDQYCAAAVTIDRAIHQLGGHKCILYDEAKHHSALTCADEGSGQLEDVVEPWIANIIPKIVQACQRPLDSDLEHTTAATTTTTTTIPEVLDPATDDKNTNGWNNDCNGANALVEKEDETDVKEEPTKGFISSEMQENGTAHTVPPLKCDPSVVKTPQVAIGVQMIQAILSQQQQQEVKEKDSSRFTDIVVDPSTLPASLFNDDVSATTMKPFTYMATTETETINENEVYSDRNDNLEQRVRGLSIGSHNATLTNNNNNIHMVDDSVSSVSAGYYYTVSNPYPAQILEARYLTNTPITAAQEVVTKQQYLTSLSSLLVESSLKEKNEEITKYASLLKEAESIYDTAFPLKLSLLSSSTMDDTVVIDQNAKRVIEMTLSLPEDSTLEYSPGDSLGILVDNPISIVEYVANLLQTNDPKIHDPYQQMIQINHEQMILHRNTAKPISIVDAIARHLDLCSVIKNKRVLYSLSQLATDLLEQKYLQLLSSKTTIGETLFKCIIDEQRMTIVDVIQLFPSIQSNITLEFLFQIVPNHIPPRYYSVSSSPLQPLHITNTTTNSNDDNISTPTRTNYLTIAFSVVDYITPTLGIIDSSSTMKGLGQRRVRGVATRYLEAISSSLLCRNIVNKNSTPQSNTISGDIPKVRIFPKPTIDFRMPHSLSTPLILVGPGTGIAPFIGFLRHRRALLRQQSNTITTNGDIHDPQSIYSTTTAAKTVVEGTWRGGYELENDNNELAISQQDESGLNVGADYRLQSNHSFDYGSVDVLFGCRNKDHDWLYKDEMNDFLEKGIISKLYTAFSRDTPSDMNNRRYVQDFILNDVECGKRLIDLIVNQDAAVYVCGDGNSMAQDVQSAFTTLLASTQFNDDRELGKAYLEDMKRKQRFLMDIWS